jgi:alcohol dehydrogenase
MKITTFNTVSRIVHGRGSIQALTDEIRLVKKDAAKVLIVSDPGVKGVGIVDRVAAVMTAAGLDVGVFAEVKAEPVFEVAEASLAFALEYRPDVVVGIGGGSSLDIAKITSVMVANIGPIKRFVGMELVEKPGIPCFLIPTTAGTGSEVTSICVLGDTENKVKKAVVSRYMYARTVLLDPDLTVDLPPHITAMTGMDALVHATESFTSVNATPFTDALNFEAIRMVGANLRRVYTKGQDCEARQNMLYASCIAGMAFSNTQNALDHAIALAIGGRYHLPHGLLTAFIFPWVVEFNMVGNPEKFSRVALALGEDIAGIPAAEAAKLSVRAIRALLADLNISTRLSSYNISRDDFAGIAKDTVGAVRLIGNNPRPVNVDDVVKLLEANY